MPKPKPNAELYVRNYRGKTSAAAHLMGTRILENTDRHGILFARDEKGNYLGNRDSGSHHIRLTYDVKIYIIILELFGCKELTNCQTASCHHFRISKFSGFENGKWYKKANQYTRGTYLVYKRRRRRRINSFVK
ncbi:uncharacterized protein Bfra_012259 [Botrytis fragariae]|uniref:Uncharacterized protein n=1 Tax=Botrytis fragariae TaxID=1964551 RepID=A0A8H6AJT4_9HELO|nr:uncharacterized protein Bfra_012259 [Botrytis fragariae]KAF5868611.1 hypothetical protein Bfra_012259 [Botrytis fragariae]